MPNMMTYIESFFLNVSNQELTIVGVGLVYERIKGTMSLYGVLVYIQDTV